jgi:outer membrane protein assembly factor BamB
LLIAEALAAVDPHNGHVAWQVSGHPIDVLVGDWNGDGKDEILVAMGGLGLLCLDPNDGHVLWTLRMGIDARPWALIKSRQGGSTSDIIIHQHASLIGVVHGPRLLWEQVAVAAIQSTPVVADAENGKRVVVEAGTWGDDISLRAFDGAEGSLRWSAVEAFSINRGVTLADLDGDGRKSIVGLGRRPGVDSLLLLSYSPSTGKVLRVVPVAAPGWLSCAPRRCRFPRHRQTPRSRP